MSAQQDFERIWTSVESIVQGALLDGDNENIFDVASDVWQREKSKWRDSGRVQYNFLLILRKKNPSYAEQFLSSVEKFSFRKVKVASSPSSIPYIFGTLCFTAVGICAGYFLPTDSFLPNLIGQLPTIILGGMVFGGIGCNIFKSLYQNKTRALLKVSATAYAGQLAPLRKTLLDLCRKADTT